MIPGPAVVSGGGVEKREMRRMRGAGWMGAQM